MPRWARFFSCGLTAVLLSLAGLALSARYREGGPDFWRQMWEFIATPEFRSLLLLCAVLSGGALVLGRALGRVYGLAAAPSGFVAGAVVAGCYVSFLVASRAAEWGGWQAALMRAWPDGLFLALPFAVAGAVAGWLWERLAA